MHAALAADAGLLHTAEGGWPWQSGWKLVGPNRRFRMSINPVRLNHAVLFVANLARAKEFYVEVFGMVVAAREPRAPAGCSSARSTPRTRDSRAAVAMTVDVFGPAVLPLANRLAGITTSPQSPDLR
jgi:glyoxalase/bleomycin resistance protein/dioxygenase superfamily protein